MRLSKQSIVISLIIGASIGIGYYLGVDNVRIKHLTDEVNSLRLRPALSPTQPERQVKSARPHDLAPEHQGKASQTNASLAEFSRQRHALSLSNMVDTAAANRNEEYNQLFSNLGLSQGDTEYFKAKLVH